MWEYITFWFAKFIADLLGAISVFAAIICIVVVLFVAGYLIEALSRYNKCRNKE